MRKEYLKVPDNVDLKEFEKFGGKVEKYYNHTYYEYKISYLESIVVNSERELFINVDDEVFDYSISDEVMCVLFDIISAGLVEKVVEDE